MKDLTNQEQAVGLLKSSESEKEWSDVCKAIKKANNGYPSWWYAVVIATGLPQQTARKGGWSAEIRATKS